MTILRVRTAWTGVYGSNALSTHYFTGTGSSDATAAVTAVAAFWGDLAPQQTGGLTWATDPAVDELALDGSLTASNAISPQFGTGSGSGGILPTQSQARCVWDTGTIVAGRRLRGATFVGGLISGVIATDGELSTSVLTDIGSAMSDLIDTGNFVVWSRKHATTGVVTGGAPDSGVRVLRSRRI